MMRGRLYIIAKDTKVGGEHLRTSNGDVLVTGDINLDHLIKVLSSRILP